MPANVDWKCVFREIRLLLTQIQPARFFALYVLALVIVLGYVFEKVLGR